VGYSEHEYIIIEHKHVRIGKYYGK